MIYVFDSNIFVAALDSTDIFHSRCQPLWAKLKAELLHVYAPVLVMSEAAGVLSRRTQKVDLVRQLHQELFYLSSITWLDMTRDTAMPATELAIVTGLSGADASIAYAAELYEIPLVTLDAGIKKRVGNRIRVIEPEAVNAAEPSPAAQAGAINKNDDSE